MERNRAARAVGRSGAAMLTLSQSLVDWRATVPQCSWRWWRPWPHEELICFVAFSGLYSNPNTVGCDPSLISTRSNSFAICSNFTVKQEVR
ncbi:hypothetical protein E2C01_094445 [Portunus trituberculatus]|uniref:Uncharacterized protein n=1 Tax=Portunus trituberculatus TaxID=210409 RepID=A0A5B7JM53_PORTR|nr:hypothetical protein [Portunus trituberculatus]